MYIYLSGLTKNILIAPPMRLIYVRSPKKSLIRDRPLRMCETACPLRMCETVRALSAHFWLQPSPTPNLEDAAKIKKGKIHYLVSVHFL